MSSQSQSAHRFQIQIIIFPEAVTFRKYLQAEIGLGLVALANQLVLTQKCIWFSSTNDIKNIQIDYSYQNWKLQDFFRYILKLYIQINTSSYSLARNFEEPGATKSAPVG